MSSLYNQIKSNINRINNIYKIGITFNNNRNWISPSDGNISIEAMAKPHRARDYAQGSTGYSYGSAGFGVSSPPDIFYSLCQQYGVYSSAPVTKLINVSKGVQYNIQFPEYESGASVLFGSTRIYTAINSLDNMKITPPPMEGGWYNYNEGTVYHIEGQDKNNPSFLGDCDVQITSYKTEPSGYVYKTTVAYQIIKIYRQPSQSPDLQQYLKIKYNQDVINLFEDTY